MFSSSSENWHKAQPLFSCALGLNWIFYSWAFLSPGGDSWRLNLLYLRQTIYIYTKVSNKLRRKCYICVYVIGFSGGSDSKEPTCQSRRPSSIPGSGRSPGERNGNPLQYSCLENPMDRGAWWTIAHRVAEFDTTEHTHTIWHTIQAWQHCCCF